MSTSIALWCATNYVLWLEWDVAMNKVYATLGYQWNTWRFFGIPCHDERIWPHELITFDAQQRCKAPPSHTNHFHASHISSKLDVEDAFLLLRTFRLDGSTLRGKRLCSSSLRESRRHCSPREGAEGPTTAEAIETPSLKSAGLDAFRGTRTR